MNFDLGHSYNDNPRIAVRPPARGMVVSSWAVEVVRMGRVVGGFPSFEAARAWTTEFMGNKQVLIFPVEDVKVATETLVMCLRVQQGLTEEGEIR